jgi:hypothetical protein
MHAALERANEKRSLLSPRHPACARRAVPPTRWGIPGQLDRILSGKASLASAGCETAAANATATRFASSDVTSLRLDASRHLDGPRIF